MSFWQILLFLLFLLFVLAVAVIYLVYVHLKTGREIKGRRQLKK